ncbi:MAG: hypothetical protein ACUZ9M_01050 [Candidatus Scalindua sp.]
MKAIRSLLYKSFFAVFLLFAVYGCQTTDSTVTSEPPVAELSSNKTESDAESVERIVPQTSTVEKETSAASVTATDDTSTEAMKETAHMKKFENNFLGLLKGHGGAEASEASDVSGEKETVNRDKPVADLAVKPAEDRPYIEMEKQLYGKWNNKIETEYYDFHDDGTVIIIVSGPRGKTRTLNGNYKIVETDRIKIDFRNDSFASQKPPSYFKISISEDQFSLTDEPKKKGEPDGSTTKYNRVE